jgi:hypothetical protein
LPSIGNHNCDDLTGGEPTEAARKPGSLKSTSPAAIQLTGKKLGEITLFASTVLLFFFFALAAAGLRGWTADSRDVEYRLWPLAPVPAAFPCHTSPDG